MACADFSKAKKEYIKGGTSYRKLSEKYKLPFGTLRKVAAKEKWRELRDKARAKSDTKIIDAISDDEAYRAVRLQTAADSLLCKLEQIIDTCSLEDIVLDKYALKQITGALKDIKDIQNIKAPLDIEEQRARITKLKKEAEQDEDAGEFVVTIEGGEDSWAE